MALQWHKICRKASSDKKVIGMPKSIETVDTGSFSMDYLRFGDGGEPLVILPGLSVQSVMGVAESVVEAYRPLTRNFTIYLLDQRRNLPGSYSVCDMANDALDAIRSLELDRICLFGVSLGGMMALKLAIEHPDLTRKLIVGSSTARVSDEQYQLFERWAALAARGDATNLYLEFGASVYPSDVFERSREQLINAAKFVTAEDLRRFAILARGTKGFDVTDSLVSIACPILAIGSSNDQIFGAEATLKIAKHLNGKSDFEMYLYDNYGHAAYDVAPDYKDRLLRFFTA